MHGPTAVRVLLAGVFVALLLIASDLMAQAPAHPSNSAANQQAHAAKAQQHHNAVENNPACQRILSECKKLGFVSGQWKKDNGLWADCFDPVVKGGKTPTREGKPINVPVSSSDLQSCRAVAEHK